MPSKGSANEAPHLTKGDVFDDIGLSPSEALEAKVKADIWNELVAYIARLNLRQKDLAMRLGVHQPDVSNLLSGKLSKFSVGTLIQYAVKLDMRIQVHLTAATAPDPKSER